MDLEVRRLGRLPDGSAPRSEPGGRVGGADPCARRAPAGIARQAGWEAVQAAANAVGVRMASAE